MSNIMPFEYFRDVWNIAQDIVAEHGDDHDAIHDAIHEWVDGSQWVIYTHRARKVLEFSSNDEAGPESMGWGPFGEECYSWSDLFTRGAYFAMCADVHEAVDSLMADRLGASIGGAL